MKQRNLTLYIDGEQGAGKSMLAAALGTLFRSLGAEVVVEDGGRYQSDSALPSLVGTHITINVEQK